MDKGFFWGVLIILGLSSCGGSSEFVINGTLDNAGSLRTVFLYEGERKLDSAFLTENGKFRFRRTASQPRLFTVQANKNEYFFILNNGEELTFRADLMQDSDVYTISGSTLSEKIQAFAAHKVANRKFEAELDEQFASQSAGVSGDALEQLRTDFIQRFREGNRTFTKLAVNFAAENDNLSGFFAMYGLDREVAEAELVAYADRIAGEYEDNYLVRNFLEEIAKLKRLAVGQPAPDFESLTPSYQPIQLSDFRGKYVLLDFWASWCVPCREENPNIVRLYNTYHDRGFTVFGVSLDGNPGPWLRAIEQDGLAWTNASDLQAWGSDVVGLYQIKAIPASYLLDPEGVILAKNLRGEELERFLTKLFN